MTRKGSSYNLLIVAAVMLASLVAGSLRASAQNDAQFTQYWAVPTYYNPTRYGYD